MHDPKSFYRELDSLLAKIEKGLSVKNLLTSILRELEQNFQLQFHICDGAIYEQRGQQFIRVHTSGSNNWNESLDGEGNAVQQVTKHGSFIYDSTGNEEFGLNHDSGHITPAAIGIHSPEKQWLLVFGLKNHWVREEVLLFLNAVRTTINYRLFSEIIGGELKQAEQIQKSLLPRRSPKFEGLDIYGKSIPAEIVGGDFYEYFELDGGNIGISVGDVSGHGLPAALLVRDVVVGLRMGLASEYKLVYTLKRLNKVIQKSTFSSNFVSMFTGEIEKNGHIFYVNAGHPAPFKVHGDSVEDLGPTGIVLGFLQDIDLYRSHTHLQPGAVLVLYTDGIFERQNEQEEFFSVDRLKELVRENQAKSAKEIVELIFNSAYGFGHATNWTDDATVVVIKRQT